MTQSTIGGQNHTATFDGLGVRVGSDGRLQVHDRVGLPSLVSDDMATYVHGVGGPLSQSMASGSLYPVGDALGSTRGVTDAAGGLVGQSTYDAYGETRSTNGTTSAFGYTGEQTDPGGLIHLRARTYQPTLGRFLQADSLQPNAGGTQGWGLYSYANGNPTTATDPTGHMAMTEEVATYDKATMEASAFLRVMVQSVKVPTGGGMPWQVYAMGALTAFAAIIVIAVGQCLAGEPLDPQIATVLASATAGLPGFLCAVKMAGQNPPSQKHRPAPGTGTGTGPDPDPGPDPVPDPGPGGPGPCPALPPGQIAPGPLDGHGRATGATASLTIANLSPAGAVKANIPFSPVGYDAARPELGA